MFRLTLIISVLAATAGVATAAPRVLGQAEGSYELELGNVQIPLSTSGFVRLRPCASCDSRTHDVNASTAYRVDGQQLPFAEFAAVVQDMRASASAAENVLVMVFYDLESSIVTRVAVHDHRN